MVRFGVAMIQVVFQRADEVSPDNAVDKIAEAATLFGADGGDVAVIGARAMSTEPLTTVQVVQAMGECGTCEKCQQTVANLENQ